MGTTLIIDDEESVRGLAKAVLERSGFHVLVAESGRKGLALFQDHMPEIGAVLLDLRMPDMSGDEVLRDLRLQRPDLDVIIMSGFSEYDSEVAIHRDPHCSFIAKPFSPAALVDKVRDALQRDCD